MNVHNSQTLLLEQALWNWYFAQQVARLFTAVDAQGDKDSARLASFNHGEQSLQAEGLRRRECFGQRMREKVMERARCGLQKVQARVEKGQLKRAEKIGAAVERVMQRYHGHRYYDWTLENGQLRYFEHPVNLPREKKYEGKYLIQTDRAI